MSSDRYMLFVYISAAAVFGLILSVWLILALVFYLRRTGRQQRVEQRLGLGGPVSTDGVRELRLWRDGEMATTTVTRVSYRASLFLRLQQIKETLGWQISPAAVGLAVLGAGLAAFVLVLVLTGDPIPATAAAALVLYVPFLLVNLRIKNQEKLFEGQLVDALSLATRSLRAGHPLIGAFRLIVEEMQPPVSNVFAEIIQQQSLGLSLEEAVRVTSARSSSSDMKLFAASMVIQLRSGGNLADMMDRLACVMRDRIRLHRKARVLVSQTQLSKNVLMAIPVVLFGLLYFIAKEYVSLLYETFPGRMMMAAAFVLLALGALVMNRIATVRY